MSLSEKIDGALLKNLPFLEREGLTVGTFADLKEDLFQILASEAKALKIKS
jgi:hypothetical protein